MRWISGDKVPTGLSWVRSSLANPPQVGALEIAFLDEGHIGLRRSGSSTMLVFDYEEWDAFLAGVREGEFDFDEHGRSDS